MRGRKMMLIVCAVCVLILTSCGETKNEEEKARAVYEFGGSEITYGEYYIYAKTIAEDYQQTYGNGVWGLELSTDDGTDSVKDITIKDIVADINRVKVMNSHTEDYGIVLSDEELSEAENRAKEFYDGLTEKDIADTEITEELAKQVITENMLAKKVYDQVLSDYDFEISDEEARMTTFYDMVFECYELKKDGSVEEYTPEKKAVQLERANEALSSLAQEEGVSYENIDNKYNLEYSSSYTMSKNQMIEEYGNSVAGLILELSDGEVSTVIETPYGYHIFKMLDFDDEELTKKNKAQMISAKQKEYFNGVYADWLKSYDSRFSFDEDVNEELINRFPFSDDEPAGGEQNN